MAFRLVIAEKPSMAQTIAAALGIKGKQDGYIEGGGYLISWCVGHLVQLAEAAAYGEQYKKWSFDSLPILPEEWQYAVDPDKGKQFKTIKELMHRADVSEVVNACDAGREGELIFRFVGILILLLSGILAWNRLDYSKVYYSGEETYKNIFYREVRGRTEEEVERYISEAEEEIDDLLQEDQTNARAGYMQSALNVIINQKEYLAQLKQDRNIRGEYVNPLGYSMLIGENGKETVRNDMLLQLFLITVLFGGYMAYENQSGMTGIVNSTAKKVRGMNRAKAVWIVCGTVIISVLFFLVELDNVTGRIGLADLDAAVQSLQYLEKVPVKITLWQYILAVGMGRTILLTAAGFLAAYCSSRCRSVRSGILVSVAVIMLPALLLGGFIL